MRIYYEFECQKCNEKEVTESPEDRRDSRCERCGGGPVEFTGKVQRRKTSESSRRSEDDTETKTTGQVSPKEGES